MTGKVPKPGDLNLDEMVRWRDHAEDRAVEDYGFEDGLYPDEFIHGEVNIAWTEYDSHLGSSGHLWMRQENGRTYLRFGRDDEPWPGAWDNHSVEVGPAISDEITVRELILIMDSFHSPYVDTLGYVQAELAWDGSARSREDRTKRREFLLCIDTISEAATAWYDAVADYWLETGELTYLPDNR